MNLTFFNIGITVRDIRIKPKTVAGSQFKYYRARCYFDLPGKDGDEFLSAFGMNLSLQASLRFNDYRVCFKESLFIKAECG